MYMTLVYCNELNQGETYLEKPHLFDPNCKYIIHWANGKIGAMVDNNNNNVMRFEGYYYEPTSETSDHDLREGYLIKEDGQTYPIVAEGIVVYWLKVLQENFSTAQIFNRYYDIKEKEYIQKNIKALDGWKRNFKREFYEKHLQQVQQHIIISEHIYPYLLEKDVDMIKELEANYLEFVKSKMQTSSNESNRELKQSESIKRMNMEESVLDKISTNNVRFYYEGWRNGKHGSICQKNGIYRFVEMARGKSGMLDDVKRSEEDNPIVAIGIVAYWLQFNSRMDPVIKRLTKYNCEIPKDIREQFDNYTKIRFEQFRKGHRDDPNTLDWDWEYEFYVNTIIPHEIAFNKRTEALFDYISDSDIKLVQAVMKNYIKYLKKCRADKGYQVSPELLVLRAVDSQDDTKYEDLEDYEVKTILEKLKDEGYIDAMWVHGQKLPWVCKILDKGRTYLKQVEEGECGISIAPVDTPQPSSEQVTTETPSQMTQPNDNSEFDQYVDNEEWDEDEDEDKVEVTPEVREYNTTYDYVFDPRVKPEEVKKALNNITTFDKYQHPFWFVFTKVLVHLQWIPTSTYTKDILKWASLQYDLHWTTKRQLSFSDIGGDKRDMNREANEGKQKKIKDTDITLWNTISKTEFRDIEKYRQFALLLKKTFVHFIVDGLEVKESTDFNLGKPLDRVKFMKSPKNLINSGK